MTHRVDIDKSYEFGEQYRANCEDCNFLSVWTSNYDEAVNAAEKHKDELAR